VTDTVIEHAHRALGTGATRIEILRFTIASGEVTSSQLMAELGLTRNGVRAHLVALTAEGLLIERHATHPRGCGPVTYWRADIDEVIAVMDALSEHVIGNALMTVS
jgi:predicted ArsR family transcriptional regulator